MKIGLLETSNMCYNSLSYFLDCLEGALKHLGGKTERIHKLNNEVLFAGYDTIIGINYFLPTDKLEDGTYVLDYFQCPYFLIYVDPPYYHHEALQSHIKNLHVIVLDRGHVDYCKKYYAPFKSVQMGYLIGPVGRSVKYADKKYDILFAGSLYSEKEFRKRAMEIIKEEWAGVVFDLLVKRGIEDPDTPMLQSLVELLNAIGAVYDDEMLKTLMNVLGTCAEYYLRGYYRRKIICTLVDAGLRVHVAGSGWEQL